MLTKSRVAIATLLSVLTISSLSACTPAPRIFARLDGGTVQFLICDPMQVKSVRVDGATVGTDDESGTLWKATGESNWQSGFVLTYGTSPPGLEQVIEPAPPDLSADEIYLAINSPADGDGTGAQVATFDPTGLSEKWTNEVGEAKESPCG
jgi:hypothetical protein